MAEAIRTKPSKTSRATLRELAEKGILTPSATGIRYILRAQNGDVEEQGFASPSDYHTRDGLCTFTSYVFTCHAWLGYNGRRAYLTAFRPLGDLRTQGTGEKCPPPINHLASRLIQQPDVRGARWLPDDGMLYGDAILVADVRRHWTLSTRKAEDGEIEMFSEGLLTPRSVTKPWTGRTEIFFHEEPCESDLIFIKLRWG